MATNKIRISPSVNFSERDLTTSNNNIIRNFNRTRLMIMGEFEYGPAFQNIRVSNYGEFSSKYGTLNPCKYKNTNQLKFQGAYTAKQFLQESSELYVCRVLGLSGYDAGDLWTINFGASVDTSTIVDGPTTSYTAEIQYVNGELSSGTFSNSVLQTMFDDGKLLGSDFGGYNVATGDTGSFNSINGFTSNCNGTFTGARFSYAVDGRTDFYVCLTGTTANGGYVQQTGLTQTCDVQFGSGTVTVNSTLRIGVTSPIVIVNQTTSDLEVVSSGTIIVLGGTITHNTDDSVTVLNGVITLPNGDIFSGGTYKICDLASNDVSYDCEGISGSGYTIATGTTVTTSLVFQSGSTTTEMQIPSGIVTIQLSGNVTTLTASALSEYDNRIVVGLRSIATYDGSEDLNFEVKNTNLLIQPLVSGEKINPYDDFIISGFKQNGTEFSYTVSLDTRKKNYINRVFAQRANCCDSNTILYVSELYQTMFDNLVAQGKIDCIKPTICHNTTLFNYKQEYRSAETPYVVSELRGNKVVRLFKFITISDGDAANRQIKISITNIRPDKKLFDVIVRDYNDTDKNPIILEQYVNCSLDVQSNNYIGKLIGGVSSTNDIYPQNSMYVTVEIASTCLFDAFPSGFEGYPIVDYGDCANAPLIQYKTSYGNDKVRIEYLGLNSNDGFDQDIFDWHGNPAVNTLSFTGTTKGFHLDVDATSVIVDGVGTLEFEVGDDEFRNESDLVGTIYSKLNARKFTFVPYGGFDGWDIHRLQTGNRTIGDEYNFRGTNGILGLQSSAFDTYVLEDFDSSPTTVINSDYYAYLKGIRTISNKEDVKFNLLVTPNINSFDNSNLVEEALEMIEEIRCDAFYLIDTPSRDADGIAINAETIANRLEGLYPSSFAATYAYDALYNDIENNTYVYVPASVDLPRIYAVNDRVKQVWWSPAGTQNGRSIFKDVIKNPTSAERDILYEQRINSLWKFNGTVLAWGSKTLEEDSESALSGINVRRMLIELRQLIADVSINLLYQQNDENVRRDFDKLIRPILTNLRTERGIFAFDINISNSPKDLNSKQLNGIISIQPVESLEQINIGFVVSNTGAEFDNV